MDLIQLETGFWEELERMGREPVSEDELARAKALNLDAATLKHWREELAWKW